MSTRSSLWTLEKPFDGGAECLQHEIFLYVFYSECLTLLKFSAETGADEQMMTESWTISEYVRFRMPVFYIIKGKQTNKKTPAQITDSPHLFTLVNSQIQIFFFLKVSTVETPLSFPLCSELFNCTPLTLVTFYAAQLLLTRRKCKAVYLILPPLMSYCDTAVRSETRAEFLLNLNSSIWAFTTVKPSQHWQTRVVQRQLLHLSDG